MDISDWRKKIDELDRRLVELLSQRAHAAHEIGKLKRGVGMPIYEPDRERAVFNNVRGMNPGPLPDRDLLRIYERIMDIMRQIQQEEIAPKARGTEHANHRARSAEGSDRILRDSGLGRRPGQLRNYPLWAGPTHTSFAYRN